MKKILLIIFLLVSNLNIATAFGQEKIRFFSSDVAINLDGSLIVKETILVYSNREQIQHGIYRDFPTRYKDKYNHVYNVDFKLVSVNRDDNVEPYHINYLYNGVKIYIGNKDYDLEEGEHKYEITYITNRQIGFFKNYDQLYWNVTGNGWSFPIENVKAKITLPRGEVLSYEGYTGYKGEKGQDYIASRENSGTVIFSSTRYLKVNEGLTVVVNWPKGIIPEPDFKSKIKYLVKDNIHILVAGIGFFIVLFYYLVVWYRFGRDPQKGTVFPLYGPPDKLSPAQMRYILKMKFDNKVFTAAIINMAVKGFIKIKEEDGKIYTLVITDLAKENLLDKEEKIIAQALFDNYQTQSLILKQENHEVINKAKALLKNSLRGSFEKKYFFNNYQWFIPGIIITVLFIVLTILFLRGDRIFVAIFMSLWLSIWSVGVSILIMQCFRTWKTFFTTKNTKVIWLSQSVFLTLFSLPFVIGEIFGLSVYVSALSFGAFLIVVGLIFLNCLFYNLLKSPTAIGRKIMDRIEGFKLYLSKAEKERFNQLQMESKDLQLFEKYFPYALALGVEQAWSMQFAGELEKIKANSDKNYSPVWYNGNNYSSMSNGSFYSFGDSFANAISSASTAPSSSDGSSGGGSSGGGGGGGGGDGW